MIYGNPTYESVELICNSILIQEWYHTGMLDELSQYSYPCEQTTKAELQQLVRLGLEVDSTRLVYIKELETDLFGVMSKFLASHGVQQTAEQIKAITDIYDPLVDYLKLVYNRPRPFQAGGHYGIPLFPRIRSDANDAAYPSGHTFLALLFYDYYSRRHPDLRKPLLKFVLDVKLSREQAGVHYPSDGLFSFQIYNHIKSLLWKGLDKKQSM